jgi:hypothetical protein
MIFIVLAPNQFPLTTTRQHAPQNIVAIDKMMFERREHMQ